jgi:hypothetical protein
MRWRLASFVFGCSLCPFAAGIWHGGWAFGHKEGQFSLVDGSGDEKGLFDDARWKQTVVIKPKIAAQVIANAIKNGQSEDDLLIFSDMDIMPLKPYCSLARYMRDDDDVLFMGESKWRDDVEDDGAFNTGFFMARPNNSSLSLMRVWVALLKAMSATNDQPPLNMILEAKNHHCCSEELQQCKLDPACKPLIPLALSGKAWVVRQFPPDVIVGRQPLLTPRTTAYHAIGVGGERDKFDKMRTGERIMKKVMAKARLRRTQKGTQRGHNKSKVLVAAEARFRANAQLGKGGFTPLKTGISADDFDSDFDSISAGRSASNSSQCRGAGSVTVHGVYTDEILPVTKLAQNRLQKLGIPYVFKRLDAAGKIDKTVHWEK